MKKNLMTKATTVMAAIMMAGVMVTGCGSAAQSSGEDQPAPVEETATTEEANAEETNAEETPAASELSTYEDANGWSVKYDPALFTVNVNGPEVMFVYQGEQAGSNVITATYTVENKGQAAVEAVGKNYTDVSYSEGVFPGTEDVPGFWATMEPTEEGSKTYMTAIGRDYMEGALVFVLDGHMSGDDALDMQVSDSMAAIIDSLTFAEGTN